MIVAELRYPFWDPCILIILTILILTINCIQLLLAVVLIVLTFVVPSMVPVYAPGNINTGTTAATGTRSAH